VKVENGRDGKENIDGTEKNRTLTGLKKANIDGTEEWAHGLHRKFELSRN
jgi:hypothetical protein